MDSDSRRDDSEEAYSRVTNNQASSSQRSHFDSESQISQSGRGGIANGRRSSSTHTDGGASVISSTATTGGGRPSGGGFTMDTFLEEELERMQTMITSLATSLKDSEQEKSALVTQLADMTTSEGSQIAKLAVRVAELEAENQYLEEELTLAHNNNNPASKAASTANNGGHSLSPDPRGTGGVPNHLREESQDPDEINIPRASNQGNSNSQGGSHQRAPPSYQRKELEYIAREDKLYMWVQMRTTELKKVSDLLAKSQMRNEELTKFIYDRLTGDQAVRPNRPPAPTTAVTPQRAATPQRTKMTSVSSKRPSIPASRNPSRAASPAQVKARSNSTALGFGSKVARPTANYSDPTTTSASMAGGSRATTTTASRTAATRASLMPPVPKFTRSNVAAAAGTNSNSHHNHHPLASFSKPVATAAARKPLFESRPRLIPNGNSSGGLDDAVPPPPSSKPKVPLLRLRSHKQSTF